jgi:hypothetical protein
MQAGRLNIWYRFLVFSFSIQAMHAQKAQLPARYQGAQLNARAKWQPDSCLVASLFSYSIHYSPLLIPLSTAN